MRQNLKSQGPAHGCQEGFCCAARPRGLVAKLIVSFLLVAVGQFRDVAPFTEPSMPDPLFDRPLIPMVGASVGSSWRVCAPN